MSSLQDLIKKIQVDAASLLSYVYYDKDTGAIHKISSINSPSTEFAIISIPNEKVTSLLTGEKRLDEFVITTDNVLNCVELKEINNVNTYDTASIMCYELPVIKNLSNSSITKNNTSDDSTVIVQQDIINKYWKVVVNSRLKNFLIYNENYLNKTLYFSITSKYDPNVFYRSLKVNIDDLLYDTPLSIPFKYTVEEDEANISIYTVKYFDKYTHEVIQ
jgi:hypothetical protein